ncbi:HofO family protein [Enterobacter oligotrophicus]
MDLIFQRWCESRPAIRVLGWCVVSCAVALVIWGMLVRPVNRQSEELNAQVNRTRQTNASLWPVVRRQHPTPEAGVARPVQPFSPLEFQAHGVTLVHWKPQQSGGELALDAGWSDIPALFSRLALRDVRVSLFDIIPQGTLLRVRIQLEINHAQ